MYIFIDIDKIHMKQTKNDPNTLKIPLINMLTDISSTLDNNKNPKGITKNINA